MLSSRLSEEELGLFSDRIARSLAERPLEMEVEVHRERAAALLREMGQATHYEILGIDPTASALEVHEGFERIARLVHPHQADRLGLAGREAALEVLFERVTEAYLTLSSIDSRKRYDRELGPRIWAVRAEALKVSRVEEADRFYDRARALARSGQVHSAVELLREAVRMTPKPDFLALLGLLEAKNPNWLGTAEQNLERALAEGSRATGLAEALAEVRRKLARLAAGESVESDDDSEDVQFV